MSMMVIKEKDPEAEKPEEEPKISENKPDIEQPVGWSCATLGDNRNDCWLLFLVISLLWLARLSRKRV